MTGKFRLLPAAFIASALFAASACAQYPEKPVRIVMPFSAGGAGDFIIRAVQAGMEKRLGKPVVSEDKLGAAGNIGVGEVVKSAPDGYTLLFGPTNSFVINQFLFRKLGFDPLEALVPVTVLAETPLIVFINGSVPASNFAEFSNYARVNGAKLNYGSAGNATITHLSAYMLSEATGWKMTHVPYKGSQPATTALVANDVQLFINSYGGTGASFLATGKVRALAVGAPQRLKILPNVPTTAEVGIPESVIQANWWGIGAPRGADPAIVNRLSQDFRVALADPDVQKKYADAGIVPIGNSPAQFAEQVRKEARVWKAIVEKSGVKAD